MYKNKRNGIIGIVITIIILIIIVFISNVNTENLSFLENSLNKIIMPIQNGLTYLKNKIAGNNTFFSDINNLKQENENLKEKNSELEQEIREMEILKTENNTLREYLNLSEKYDGFETLPAYVINRDINNYSRIIVINVGAKDGVEKEMAVIADKGLVGHVISVSDNTAKVQTIIDTSNTVSCTLSTSRESVICRGTLEKINILKATYIPTDASLILEDSIETSGMGGIYPKGIHVGKLKQVINTKNITDRYAIIETAVDFDKLETVLVIK